jgi:ABC-type multidrug transport system, ATPase component
MNNVIEITDLSKEFDGFVAVNHISLGVKEGDVFGLLGPNGAGKTTITKILCTILNPTSGSVKVCGYDVARQKDSVRACIGIVFQDSCIDRFLTGKKTLISTPECIIWMVRQGKEELMRSLICLS